MAAVACTLSLLAGCTAKLDSAEEGAISFSAGSALLRDDATKTGTPKTGTTFSEGDAFLAWGWHDAANQYIRFGTSSAVTLGSNGLWDYAPHQFWNWMGSGDFYDFLAIYPANADITPFEATLGNSNLKAIVTYVPTETQYDLMAAGYRRTDRAVDIVSLTFSHLLSAVSLEVKNSAVSIDSNGDPLTITLKSCRFINLITSSDIKVTFDGTTLGVTNVSNTISDTPVLGPSIPANTTLAPGSRYPIEDVWDIMVPQDLNSQGNLQIEFNKGGEDITETIALKDIKKENAPLETISSWEAGMKYHYKIELCFGVGIIVTVKTTPWEEVEAETPGIQIQ